jgi:uncharacterized RDD family membrane protein YckC
MSLSETRLWQPDPLTTALDLPDESGQRRVTYPVVGFGLRMASEGLDLLVMILLALLVSSFLPGLGLENREAGESERATISGASGPVMVTKPEGTQTEVVSMRASENATALQASRDRGAAERTERARRTTREERSEQAQPTDSLSSPSVAGAIGSDLPEDPAVQEAIRAQAARSRAELQTLVLLALLFHLGLPFVLALVGQGRTPGMMLLSLKLHSLRDGDHPRLGQLLTRALLRPVDFLPLTYLGAAYFARRDPFGAQRWLGDQAASTILLRSQPLKDELENLGVPPTVYSESEAGYLVEALLARKDQLPPARMEQLARPLAHHISECYPAEIGPRQKDLLARRDYLAFLRSLTST